MTWAKGPGKWCPENDGAYQAEMAALHRPKNRRVVCVSCGQGGAGPNPPYKCHKCGADMVEGAET